MCRHVQGEPEQAHGHACEVSGREGGRGGGTFDFQCCKSLSKVDADNIRLHVCLDVVLRGDGLQLTWNATFKY